jgi:LysR family transcriptional regulator for bpeEF and oprC
VDLNEIYVFSKVVELQSFTKASKFLGVPKSRISRKVASLERELGVQLLFRTTRQLELTPAGRKYFQKCYALITELDSLNSEISSYSDDISGSICVTAPEDIAVRFFSKIASEFMTIYPRVGFDFYLTGRRVDLIKEPVDLALRVGKLNDSTFISRKVGEFYSILVATPLFLSLHPELKNINELNTISTIGFGEMGKVQDWVLLHNKKEITIKPKCRLMTNTMDVLLGLVLENKGIAMMPGFIVNEKILTGELVHVFKGYQSKTMPVHFLTAPQKEIPLKVKRFMEFASLKLASSFS